MNQAGYQDFRIILTPQNYTLFNLATGIVNLMNQTIGSEYFFTTPNPNTGTIQITLTQAGATALIGFFF